MKGPVKDKLKRFGFFSRLGDLRFFATTGEAVNRYLESHSVEWVDWEDRAGASVREGAPNARTSLPAGSLA
jgi:hypothetical protein